MNPIQPIQPLAVPRSINVVEPVSPALEHVKRMLFQPFDLGKWFVIGFCAWLACLGEGGAGSGGGNFNLGNHSGRSGTDFRQALDEAKNYLLNNLEWIIPLAALVVLFFVALGLLFLWLNCRGKFMFLHCVALNRAEVTEPWTKFAAEANSLFWFRLGLGFIGMVLTLPLLGIIIVLVLRMAYRGEVDVGGILTAVGFGFAFFLMVFVLVIIKKLTVDFVVPVMFLRRSGCLAAWREFYRLLCAHIGTFVLYLLFSLVLAIAIGLVVGLVFLLTCCVCCLALVPYIGTVLLLPVLVFQRAYSLYFFAQFGPACDVFPPPPPAMPASAAGLPPLPVAPPAM
jgi:hypothetical protein